MVNHRTHSPLPSFYIAAPLPVVITTRYYRCFFEDQPPNIIFIVNYEHKEVPGQPKAPNPVLLKATVKTEQQEVLCAALRPSAHLFHSSSPCYVVLSVRYDHVLEEKGRSVVLRALLQRQWLAL